MTLSRVRPAEAREPTGMLAERGHGPNDRRPPLQRSTEYRNYFSVL
jgi:hypothetical protein